MMTTEGSLELETAQKHFEARRITRLDLAEVRTLWARGCACGRPTRRVVGNPRRALCAQCAQAADVDRSIARQRAEVAAMRQR